MSVHRSPLVPGVVLTAAACVAPSCTSSYGGANRSSNVREAGSVHVAVVSVAPWSRYVDKLQPDFDLTEAEALGQILRDSRIGRTDETSAFGIVGERVDREGDAEGDVPDRSLETSRSGIPPWLDNLEQAPAERADPFLEYAAAAALYQEVQLLSSAVRDAAIPDGHVGFVVRLQITLLPRRRHAPYDAYTTLGFFMPVGDGIPSPRGSAGPAPATPMRGDGELVANTAVDPRGPRVLPLLVTDSLEATLRERSAQETLALSLSLASFKPELSQMFGADAIQSASQDFMRGRDLNAILTVGRLSENTLQVRLGAMQEVTADYAMVPRTYNITALVTVPEGRGDELELVARTRIVDAETGEELPGASLSETTDLLRGVLADYDLGRDVDLGERLLAQARANDDVAFGRTLEDSVGRDSLAWRQRGALWIDLVGLVAGTQYGSDRIDLPDPGLTGRTSEYFYEQTPVLTDNGVEAVVRVTGLELDEGTSAEALLEIDGAVQARIPAERVEQSPVGTFLELGFPSLQAAGLLSPDTPPRTSLRLRWGAEEATFDVVIAR